MNDRLASYRTLLNHTKLQIQTNKVVDKTHIHIATDGKTRQSHQ